jgi:hypothetical protein
VYLVFEDKAFSTLVLNELFKSVYYFQVSVWLLVLISSVGRLSETQAVITAILIEVHNHSSKKNKNQRTSNINMTMVLKNLKKNHIISP